MTIIADSGSTKTDWCLCTSKETYQIVKAKGINPFYQEKEDIIKTICEAIGQCSNPERIFFYGAGCTAEKSVIIKDIFNQMYPECQEIKVGSDLLGAAKSACGNKAGIAAILGTGSNSCQYDGIKIEKHIPPLGFILGDEGSGATIGKSFIADGMKGIISDELFNSFLKEYNTSTPQIMDNIYKKEFPNRYLASICPFLYRNKGNKEVHDLLIRNFRNFFIRNIKRYNYHDYKVNFVGSIGFYFIDEVKEAAKLEDVMTGDFIKSPIDGLIKFYM